MKKKRVGKAKRGCCGLGLIIILNKVDREGLTEKVPFEGKDERRGGNHVTQQGGGQSTSGRGPSKHPEMEKKHLPPPIMFKSVIYSIGV